MKTEEEQCMRILTNAVNECKSDWIALSGGLDSSILAHLRKDQKPQTMTIITKDFLGTDLTFAQIIACLLYTSPSPRDRTRSRMPSSA